MEAEQRSGHIPQAKRERGEVMPVIPSSLSMVCSGFCEAGPLGGIYQRHMETGKMFMFLSMAGQGNPGKDSGSLDRRRGF